MSAALLPGSQVGSIEIDAIVGAGEEAIVYLGSDNAGGGRVVLKEYFPLATASRNPGTGAVEALNAGTRLGALQIEDTAARLEFVLRALERRQIELTAEAALRRAVG